MVTDKDRKSEIQITAMMLDCCPSGHHKIKVYSQNVPCIYQGSNEKRQQTKSQKTLHLDHANSGETG